VLAQEVPDALARLAEAIRWLDARGEAPLRAAVSPLGFGVGLLATAYARARDIVADAAELACQ
jgi:hypothetical protein